jgi:hypothetical protein
VKPTNIETFIATAAAIGGYLIVAATANDKVLKATAATDLLIGTTDQFGIGAAGGPIGIALGGVSEVVLGGTVENGEPITADGNGKGVKCTPTANTQKRYIGFATQRGDAGDIIKYRCAPGILWQPADPA